jgi:hypothetical protein
VGTVESPPVDSSFIGLANQFSGRDTHRGLASVSETVRAWWGSFVDWIYPPILWIEEPVSNAGSYIANNADDLWARFVAWFHGRLTFQHTSKAVSITLAVLLALYVLGWVTGIRGKRPLGRLFVAVPGNSNKVDDSQVRLPRDDNTKRYDGGSGVIVFRQPGPERPFWKRILFLGRPKRLLKIRCKLTVAPTRQQAKVHVDQQTGAELAAAIAGKDIDDYDTILAQNDVDVTVKGAHNILFLLFHPDIGLKTAAWVVVITSGFEILRGFLFGE